MKKNCFLLVFLLIINFSVISQNANDYYTAAIGDIKNDKYDDALKKLNKAIELNPNYKEAYFSRGFVYHTTNRFNQAIKDYNKAQELNFTSIDLNYYRGLAYFDLNNYDKALIDFNKTLDVPDNKFFLIYIRRADIYYIQNKYNLAINDYNKLIETGKKDYYSYFLKSAASLKISNDDYTKAVEDIKMIIGKIDNSWQKAIASLIIGAINADVLISEAKEDKEKLCEAYFYIGINYLAKNDKDKARNYFNKCVDTDQVKFTEYKYAKSELKNLK